MKTRFHRVAVLLAGGIGSAFLLAVATARAGDDAVPQGYEVTRYAPLWEHSPFTIASVQQATPQAGFAQDLAVVGIARLLNEDMVTVVNKQSQERFTLGADANEKGIKVVSVEIDADPLKTKVTIQKGTEVATVGFDKSLLAFSQTTAPAVANAPGQPAGANPPPAGALPPPARIIRHVPPLPVSNAAGGAITPGMPPAR